MQAVLSGISSNNNSNISLDTKADKSVFGILFIESARLTILQSVRYKLFLIEIA